MNYGRIKKCDISNGLGVRTSLFVSGCENHCKGCFNPETWNFNYGKPFTNHEMRDILASCEPDYIRGLSILGGDPLHPNNQETVCQIVKEFRKRFHDFKDIWIYTGYEYEDIPLTTYLCPILGNTDILVDGPFIEDLKDIRLKFRGSSNQRIIDMTKTIQTGTVILADI